MKRIMESTVQDYEVRHVERLRAIAPECTVLLKKDGTFPLSRAGKIAVYGNGVRHTVKGGTSSGDVNVRHFTTVEEGLANAGFTITTEEWLDGYDRELRKAQKAFGQVLKEQAKAAGVSVAMLALGQVAPEPEYELPLTGDGETAIYVLSRNSGEAGDRNAVSGDIGLTETEQRDILALNEKYERFMLVLNVGGMVDIQPVENIKNILLLGQLGMVTGDVLADILLGKSYPSGKLTMTWADINDYPSTEGFGNINNTVYQEGLYVGYRYFDRAKKKVIRPFGYGLGYTDFEISCGEILTNKNMVTVTAVVRNTGGERGKEVVQLYFSAPGKIADKTFQELAGFAKTRELLPGESCELKIVFDVRDMASYDESTSSYILEEGAYVLRLGNSSQTTFACAVLQISNQVVTRRLKNICGADKVQTPNISSCLPVKPIEIPEDIPVVWISALEIGTEQIVYGEEDFSDNLYGEKYLWSDVCSGKCGIAEFAQGLTDQELAYICTGSTTDRDDLGSIIGHIDAAVAGASGETTGKLKNSHELGSIVLADGPAGVRISSVYQMSEKTAQSIGKSFGKELEVFLEEEDMAELMGAMTAPKTQKEDVSGSFYQYCTAIPIGTDLAQAFNPEVIAVCGDIVGTEMEMFGISLWLAPALNIHRSPLCGRNFEYYSEDPLVSGLTAAAMTESVQKHPGCGVTIKHFACNNQETNRYGSNSIVSERALREIYLRGFEICVRRAKPISVMSSYNLLNNEHTCNSYDLLTSVLRKEWGFDGIVMTDWFVTIDAMKRPDGEHGTASAAGCVKAGNDLVMPGLRSDVEDILEALGNAEHAYAITRKELLVCAVRVLKAIKRLEGEHNL